MSLALMFQYNISPPIMFPRIFVQVDVAVGAHSMYTARRGRVARNYLLNTLHTQVASHVQGLDV
jgi:hypothetical protein